MNVSRYVFLVLFTVICVVPVLRFYTSEKSISDCMIDYVESIRANNFRGYMYNIDGLNHIEPAGSNMTQHLAEYKVWYATWCVMTSGNLFRDFNNTVYCSLTYMILESPFPQSMKQPLDYTL